MKETSLLSANLPRHYLATRNSDTWGLHSLNTSDMQADCETGRPICPRTREKTLTPFRTRIAIFRRTERNKQRQGKRKRNQRKKAPLRLIRPQTIRGFQTEITKTQAQQTRTRIVRGLGPPHSLDAATCVRHAVATPALSLLIACPHTWDSRAFHEFSLAIEEEESA